MPSSITLDDNKKAARKMLATYVDVGAAETAVTSATWQLVGVGVEDSSIEYNTEIEETQDITGAVETTITSMKPTQDLAPMTVRGGSALHTKLLDILAANDTMALSQFRVMIAKSYYTENTGIYAEVHTGCTIEPLSEGGSATVDMPIKIHFSNNKTKGTIDAIKASPTFTEA